MNSSERPTLFYLFRIGDDIEIKAMTDVEADSLWKQGKRWLDIPQKTRSDAEKLRVLLNNVQR